MAYVFPYENVFVAGVGLLILALLVGRMFLRKRQLAQEKTAEIPSRSSDHSDHQPLV